jgi:hypothetical protein
MIIGHIGVAAAVRWRWPTIPLPWILVATFAPDIARLTLAAAGYNWWEYNTYSHALPWSGVLAAALTLAAWIVLGSVRDASVVGLLVASHIALDMISGWKSLWLGGPVGLDLEHLQQLEFMIEAALVLAGWRLLRRTTVTRWIASWSMAILLIAAQAAYLVKSYSERQESHRCLMYPMFPCWTQL